MNKGDGPLHCWDGGGDRGGDKGRLWGEGRRRRGGMLMKARG